MKRSNWKVAIQEKRQASLAAKRAKREAASFRARMADHFYGLSEKVELRRKKEEIVVEAAA